MMALHNDIGIIDAFEGDADARRAWRDHGERLMAENRQPGCRPIAWWRFDRGDAQVVDDWTTPLMRGERPTEEASAAAAPAGSVEPWRHALEAVRLLELGQLRDDEFRHLDGSARVHIRHYREDLQPGMLDALLDFYRAHGLAK